MAQAKNNLQPPPPPPPPASQQPPPPPPPQPPPQPPPTPPPPPPPPPGCPRCDSSDTKFCYYNNHSFNQPRYFCKTCRRYWTQGGTLRNIPIGGGCRKERRARRAYTNPNLLHPPPQRQQQQQQQQQFNFASIARTNLADNNANIIKFPSFLTRNKEASNYIITSASSSSSSSMISSSISTTTNNSAASSMYYPGAGLPNYMSSSSNAAFHQSLSNYQAPPPATYNNFSSSSSSSSSLSTRFNQLRLPPLGMQQQQQQPQQEAQVYRQLQNQALHASCRNNMPQGMLASEQFAGTNQLPNGSNNSNSLINNIGTFNSNNILLDLPAGFGPPPSPSLF